VQGSAVISGCTYGIRDGTGHTVQGSAVISGCNYGVYAGTGHTVQGSAVISGCTSGIMYGAGHTVQGSAVISGCTNGIAYGVGTIRAATLNNTVDINLSGGNWIGYGASLDGPTQVANYLAAVVGVAAGFENGVAVFDIGGTARTYPKTWNRGGTSLAVTTGDLPEGYTEASELTFVTASHENFVDVPIWFPYGVAVTISAAMKKSENGMTATPRIELLDPDLPLVDGAPLDTETMTDNTDWQTKTLEYTENTRPSGRMLNLRARGTNASGTLRWAHTVAFAGGGGYIPPMRRIGAVGVR